MSTNRLRGGTSASAGDGRTGLLRIGVLGPMVAHIDDRQVPLGPPRRRALLALLLTRLGHVVPTQLLIEELWGRRPPQRGSLHSYISHLRRALAPASGAGEGESVVRHLSSGYVLELAPEQIDSHRFERLVAQGRGLQGRGDHHAAREALTGALELWRGAPYVDLADYTPLAEERARLEQVRLTALETWADACLELGGAEAVAARLDADVRRHPMRERLVGKLMTAQYRIGQRADALFVFARTRDCLSRELGVDVSEDLQQLHRAILRQELDVTETHHNSDGFDSADNAVTLRAPAATSAVRPAAEDSTRVTTPGTETEGQQPFTGRDPELAELRALVADTLRGEGRSAAVLGDPGMGKSRLLMELAAGQPADQLEVVWGYCVTGAGVPPFWLWTQVLRRLSASRPDAFRAAAERFGDLLTPLFAGPSACQNSGERHCDPSERFRTYDAICEILIALADERPLLLSLEDLHWADAPSLDLLRLLTTRQSARALGIVWSARAWDIETDPALQQPLGDALRNPRTQTLRLPSLSEESVASLITAAAGPGVDADIVHRLYERSGGNPYFVTQLLSLFAGTEQLHDPSAARRKLTAIPSGVRAVLRQRFATLPEGAEEILRICAVLGATVDVRLLEEIAGQSPATTAFLESAVHAALMHEDAHHPDVLHFSHALVRETLYGELGRAQRARLHAQVARILMTRAGDLPEDIERIAHHAWEGARELTDDEVLPQLVRAAEEAELRLAYEQAERWLRRATDLVRSLPPGDPSAPAREQHLQTQLGQLLALTRGYGDADAEAALTRSRALNPITGAADRPSVLWALCTAHMVSGRYEGSLQFSDRLGHLAEETQDPVAFLGSHYGRGIVLHTRGQLPQALVELEKAVTLADHFTDREGSRLARVFQHDPRVSCRSYDAFTHWLMGSVEQATQRRAELLALTDHDSRPSDRAFALYVDAVLAALEGDVATAERSSTLGVEVAGRYGLRYWRAMLEVCQGWSAAHSGHEERGITQIRSALTELRVSRTRIRLPLHLGFLAEAQHHAGRKDDARTTLRELLASVECRNEYVYLHERFPVTALRRKLLGTARVCSGGVR
ncbi:AAA family ATPase [Streptomyces sp. NBC_00191]|uniref:BTAD domain-containing putative transcriptional regulator n=1 Tax=Streptomyces sp. NBC_00191 TaxID=2975674 RepID=UPI0032508C54